MKRITVRKGLLLALCTSGIISAAHVAGAVTADDVVCTGCVGTTDLANGAVGTLKLQDGAVGTSKLQNGAVGTLKLKDGAVGTSKLQNGAVGTFKLKNDAVTYPKLAPDLKTIVDDAASYDYRDYSSASGNVTEKIWALTGDFGNCGGAGAPDTEVETLQRIDEGGGVTRVISTRWRYTGGVSGTPCRKDINTYILDAYGYKLIRNRVFAADGITKLRDIITEYDAVNEPEAGLKLASTDMVLGIDFQSAGLTTDTVNASSGAFVSKVVLTDVGLSETIDEGGSNQETFNDCLDTNEVRMSTHLGVRSTIRVFCAGIGSVSRGQVEGDKSYNVWELVGYTASP